jgi:hypothetical protein
MSKQRIFILFTTIMGLSIPAAMATEGNIDRIEVRGGAILTGIIAESTREVIRLQTDYAGVIQIDAARVERIVTRRAVPGVIPEGVKRVDPSFGPVAAPPKAVPPKPAPKSSSPGKRNWEIEAGMNLVGSEGNSEKLDLGLTLDTRLKREFYRLDLYGRYSYSTNRGNETSNELILGGRYTNFFYKRFGFFLREELEHDGFEGVTLRSTSAAGFSWRLHQEEELNVEARSGLSYRFEDYKDDGTKTFPGMDFGVDVNWKFAPWVHFKGSYGFIPSFDDFNDFIVTQDSGFNIPLNATKLWKLRFGLTSKYNNRPDGNREALDHKYYARLIASWK